MFEFVFSFKPTDQRHRGKSYLPTLVSCSIIRIVSSNMCIYATESQVLVWCTTDGLYYQLSIWVRGLNSIWTWQVCILQPLRSLYSHIQIRYHRIVEISRGTASRTHRCWVDSTTKAAVQQLLYWQCVIPYNGDVNYQCYI